MTKDRPRNRGGNTGKSGDFRGSREGGRPIERQPHSDKRQHKPAYERREAAFEENGEVWIWGLHAAGAALKNPLRKISVAYVSPGAAQRAGLDVTPCPGSRT